MSVLTGSLGFGNPVSVVVGITWQNLVSAHKAQCGGSKTCGSFQKPGAPCMAPKSQDPSYQDLHKQDPQSSPGAYIPEHPGARGLVGTPGKRPLVEVLGPPLKPTRSTQEPQVNPLELRIPSLAQLPKPFVLVGSLYLLYMALECSLYLPCRALQCSFYLLYAAI